MDEGGHACTQPLLRPLHFLLHPRNPLPCQASVEVDVSILQAAPEGGAGGTKLLASATGIFKRIGGLRAL
jgi:hypothetical protein